MATVVLPKLRGPLKGRGEPKRRDPVLESPDAQRRRVRWTRLVVGALVMISAMIGAWLFVQSQSNTVNVWVTRDRIEAGSTIQDSQVVVRPVEADSQLQALGSDSQIFNRVVRIAIPAGSTLNEGHFFGSADGVGSGLGSIAQATVIFSEGHIPPSVEANDLVRIQIVDDQGATEPVIFDQVPVISVMTSDRGTSLVTVEIGIDENDRLLNAQAGGTAWASIVGRR